MTIISKDIISIITAIATIITLHVRLCHNLFMENIKRKYKEVPGKESILSVMINWISYVGIIVYILFVVIYLIKDVVLYNYSEFKVTLMSTIGAFLVIFILVVMFRTIMRFFYLQRIFVERLEGNRNGIKNNSGTQNRIDVAMLAISFVIYAGLIIAEILTRFKLGNGNIIILEDSKASVSLFMVIVNASIIGTSLIIAINMMEIINVLNTNDRYELVTGEIICCRMYLEYKDYYLIIQNGMERYVNKSSVKEIRKIRVTK